MATGTLLHAYRRPYGRWRGIVRYTADLEQQYEQARDLGDITKSHDPT